MGEFTIYINNFITYGLNRGRNFMQAPECDSGKMAIVLKTEEDLFDLMGGILSGCEYDNCAIFAVGYHGETYAAIKYFDQDGESNIGIVQSKTKNDMHMFSDIDADFSLHCYGLIIEQKPGQWIIQE